MCDCSSSGGRGSPLLSDRGVTRRHLCSGLRGRGRAVHLGLFSENIYEIFYKLRSNLHLTLMGYFYEHAVR